MTEIARLLEVRRKAKARKPEFLIQDFHKRKELPKKWRRPRGLHSKLRMRKKGHPHHVEIGFSSPAAVRHLDRKGMKRVLVSNVGDLENLDRQREVALIRHGVGLKKAVLILEAASKLGLGVVGERKVKARLEKRSRKKPESKQAGLKQEKPELREEKPELKKDAAEAPALSDEERKEAEKREKDKVLTRREM
ncbi:50S ribosomal protein L32e [Candidatus Woesearchaeota archaeon]|nr:50S ribosomal protein L32e [Candidatus Woesearchaeota archaeon]